MNKINKTGWVETSLLHCNRFTGRSSSI